MAAFALASCARETVPEPSGEGTGDLIVRIAAPKATGTKAGTAADGDVMNNLHIWIVNPAEKVVRYASWSGTDGDIVMNSGNSTATATFTNIERNTYTVYLIANKPSGMTVPAVGSTVSDSFKKYVLSGFTNNAPDFEGNGMPLSLVESISISAGKNNLSAELIRACGRIRVSVRNNTLDKNIFLQSVALGEKNPDRGYLFQQDDHSVPSDIGYVGFKDSFSYTTAGKTVSEYVAPGKVKTIIDQYIYESGVDRVANMGLQFAGGIFNEDITGAIVDVIGSASYTTAGSEFSVFNATNAPKVDGNNTKLMIVRNRTANYFMKASGSDVIGKIRTSIDEVLAGSDVKDYLWIFNFNDYGSPPTYMNFIKNYGTGTYMAIPGDGTVVLNSNPNNLRVGSQPKGMLINNPNNGHNLNSGSNIDGGNIVSDYQSGVASDLNYYWYMTPIDETINNQAFKDALKSFSKSLPNINYVNDFGVSVPLTQICRNEDVNIVINVFYNPEFALVYFDVEAWTGVDNETTFD